ncbi:hypothetical protein WICMUC_004421 [Wickerhamomyces mucosus]|uniref:ABC1 atypical kinase-like domain-containing protein n=1 Tax=Wickerhamomyces mucosus TaxID=1378264 RepID=A0A9P8PJ24_9ASCO|nr:hypothetical protein WICMUC_004421 [Wickerhamomyces mucosus]
MVSQSLLRRLYSSAAAKSVRPTTDITTKSQPRLSKLSKTALFLTGTFGLTYIYDKTINESTITRTIKAFYTLGLIGYDYKFRFNEKNDISALHEHNADRLFNLLMENKGLYIKLGQNLANQASVFPKSFQEKFAKLYDSASIDPEEKVEQILIEELGINYMDNFNYIDKKPVASASIAQVHKGELKSGEKVAIKVQHYYIAKQIDADLFTYAIFNRLYEKAFEIPIAFVSDYIAEHLKEEVDFNIELNNSLKVKELIARDVYLKNKIHVPKVYKELSTKRVLTAEWCDGDSLVSYDSLKTKYDTKKIMNDYLTIFSKMIFEWGFVHSDPHPGNILVRYNEQSGKQQLVLLDHGLYVAIRENVRHEYCVLWKSLFELNDKELKKIAVSWGIGKDQSDMFASFSLLKPYHKTADNLSKMSRFEREKYMSQNFKKFFQDTEKFPLELVFLGRTMRIVQTVNQRFKAPVNRINLFTKEAVKGFYLNEPKVNYTLSRTLDRTVRYTIFSLLMSISDLTFYLTRFSSYLFGTKNVEDLLQAKMVQEMKQMGIDAPQDVQLFDG